MKGDKNAAFTSFIRFASFELVASFEFVTSFKLVTSFEFVPQFELVLSLKFIPQFEFFVWFLRVFLFGTVETFFGTFRSFFRVASFIDKQCTICGKQRDFRHECRKKQGNGLQSGAGDYRGSDFKSKAQK